MKGSNKPELQKGWAVYLRSSMAETYGHLAAQRVIVQHEVIADSDLPILHEYVERDSGQGDQPKLQRLLSDAAQGRFSHVAVASLDRLSRSDAECERMLAELVASGITVQIGNANESSVPLF